MDYDIDNPRLKNDVPEYRDLHKWIIRELGRPLKCERCKTITAKIYDWANKTGEYKRELDDWMRLCRKCHSNYDGVAQKIWKKRREIL